MTPASSQPQLLNKLEPKNLKKLETAFLESQATERSQDGLMTSKTNLKPVGMTESGQDKREDSDAGQGDKRR